MNEVAAAAARTCDAQHAPEQALQGLRDRRFEHHVADAHAPPGPEHAQHLVGRTVHVREGTQRALAQHRVERVPGKRQRAGFAARPVQTVRRGLFPASAQVLRRVVEAHTAAAEVLRPQREAAPPAGGHVQDHGAGMQQRGRAQPARELRAAGMKARAQQEARDLELVEPGAAGRDRPRAAQRPSPRLLTDQS